MGDVCTGQPKTRNQLFHLLSNGPCVRQLGTTLSIVPPTRSNLVLRLHSFLMKQFGSVSIWSFFRVPNILPLRCCSRNVAKIVSKFIVVEIFYSFENFQTFRFNLLGSQLERYNREEETQNLLKFNLRPGWWTQQKSNEKWDQNLNDTLTSQASKKCENPFV